jgi:hypothetical protein
MSNFSLSNELNSKNAIVVHFSHHAKMREGGIFPDDLMAAINNQSSWALSCCVLWPGHQMDLPGSVGIIFKPLESNVLSVSSSDSGSSVGCDGSDQSSGLPLSPATFEQTFYPNINSYNEWRVLGAEVDGLFISNPQDIWVKQKIDFAGHGFVTSDIGATNVSLEYVLECFPHLGVFTLGANGLVPIPRPPTGV